MALLFPGVSDASHVEAEPRKLAAASENIASVQVLRGFAAVAVVFYHAYIILMEPTYVGVAVFEPVARFGFLGVSFFFVLSGFIIFKAHWRDLGQPGRLPFYIYKRAARVYPAYWIYLTGFVLAAAAGIGYPDFSWQPLNMVSSYLLFPLVENVTLPLKVAWTLVYEIRFYLLFAILILLGARALWAFAAWGVLILTGFILGWPGLSDILSLWNLYFLMGMAGFLLLNRLPPRSGIVLLSAGVGFFSAFTVMGQGITRIADLDNPARQYLHLFLAPAFLLVILGAIQIERRYRLTFPAPLLFLGDASYSIYLVHSAAISLAAQTGRKLGLIDPLGSELFYMLTFAGGVIGGCLAYVIVERPLLRLSRRIIAG